MLRKSIIIAHKSIDYIVLIAALLLFLICLYAMIDAYMVYAGANDSNIMKYKPAAGYPVMQGETNSEYLNKDPYGEFSLSGSIFLDSRNDKMFSDPYSLVYGHHMEYGAMFGSLDGYADREYFDAHRTGTLTVIKGAEYKITFFASCKAQATEKVIFDPPESSNQALLEYLNKHAIIYDPRGVSAGSKLIALSTCQSAESYERMIVFGTLN